MTQQTHTKQKQTGVASFLSKPLVKVIGLAVFIVLIIVAVTVVLSGQNSDASANGSAYLYPISTQNVLDMCAFDDGLAVVGNHSVFYVDDGGNTIDILSHDYAQPVLRAAGRYTLLFDRGGTRLQIARSAKLRREIEFEAAVTSADICPAGAYAYVLNADLKNFQSHLFIFSSNDDKLFEWGSSSDYITQLFLNSKGNRLIAVCFGVDSTSHYSRVLSFDFNKQDPVLDIPFQDETVFGAYFLSSGKIAVYSDKGLYLLDESGNEPEQIRSFESDVMGHAAGGDSGLCAFSVKRFGNEQNSTVSVFSNNLKKSSDFSFDMPVTALDVYGSKTAVVMGQKAAVLSRTKIIGTVNLKESCIRCILKNNRLYTLTPGGVRCDGISGKTTLD